MLFKKNFAVFPPIEQIFSFLRPSILWQYKTSWKIPGRDVLTKFPNFSDDKYIKNVKSRPERGRLRPDTSTLAIPVFEINHGGLKWECFLAIWKNYACYWPV